MLALAAGASDRALAATDTYSIKNGPTPLVSWSPQYGVDFRSKPPIGQLSITETDGNATISGANIKAAIIAKLAADPNWNMYQYEDSGVYCATEAGQSYNPNEIPATVGLRFACAVHPIISGHGQLWFALELIAPAVQTVYYIHTDHLSTPRVITNSAGQAVWRWDNMDPFGLDAPDENPSGLGSFTCNLRYPGQYFDKETNLHYNYFRDYDPSIGRYIQSDPIGLEGGLNMYGYVGGNPLSRIDPTGEQAQAAAAACGPYFWLCAGVISGAIMASTPQGRTAISNAASSISNAICPPGDKDPCKGLRDILKEHEDKLRNYLNDPLGNDNRGILSQAYLANNGARASAIYEGRIRELKKQIANFKKQLEECERMNGKK